MVVDADPSGTGDFEFVGSFRYLNADDRWEWSDAVAAMHGYAPGTVQPTTELVLSHKHPGDKSTVAEIIDRVRHHGAAFSSRHRIIDTRGDEHVVVVVADQLRGESGEVIGTSGFYVDVTQSFEADVQRSVSRYVADLDEKRAVIQQAVGMIRMAYGVSAGRAFDVLVWRSQETNVKLREIAERFVNRVSAAPLSGDARTRLDHVLLTAHQPDD
ncbi:RNA-binding protein with PAS domain [Mycolicibacterium chubuense NBB4]|uniref:RNA-binding protein with PAS domain n=1 Tax=Mycolicibacterium chubuense (strain NBB4) TaxID=710421 RepID=I4BJL6_MYCCN|nr:PAS and ANTAR domain-containing protein [Mycolicibacterium chubuense]AFM17473.1 RNA-binding protein with PAS domain [Mycolicibacterium chubuense NBB4]